jgi:hypothetical protein
MLYLFKKGLSVFLFTIFSMLFITVMPSFAGLNTTLNVPLNYKNIGNPMGITVMANGDIWFSDSLNNRIAKINQSGVELMSIGRLGSGDGEFNNPRGITNDNQGNIYVADYGNNRVQKFDSNGSFLLQIGTPGSNDGQLSGPSDVQYDVFTGTILVADLFNNRIEKFSKDGVFLSKFGSYGNGDGQFHDLVALYTDATGKIYTLDTVTSIGNARVQVFTSSYAFIRKFGSSVSGADDELFTPDDVISLADGSILVSCQNVYVIKKFD